MKIKHVLFPILQDGGWENWEAGYSKKKREAKKADAVAR